VPCSSRIKVGKKYSNFGKFRGGPDKSGTSTRQIQSLVLFDRINLALLLDKSSETGQIRFKAGHIRQTILVAMFDDYFRRNLLTVSLIDPILLPIAL
jgi:hypothetical protein